MIYQLSNILQHLGQKSIVPAVSREGTVFVLVLQRTL